ncbi:MAG: biopolymer transporter ExbD [Planctomycetota bacterium]|nr:biopolymer transporter ExbD [Planctomycetota bacterium]
MRSPQLLDSGTATINMTPMIDVVFLLIIFFLVSSHLAKQENSLALDLPEAVSGLDEDSERTNVVVNVLEDGSFQIGGSLVNETGLLSAFQSRVASSQEPLRLKIRTDRKVTYRAIEPILRQATLAGIVDIVFSVFEDRKR